MSQGEPEASRLGGNMVGQKQKCPDKRGIFHGTRFGSGEFRHHGFRDIRIGVDILHIV
ncbi:hypothetical protein GCM10008940_25220 [Microbulbifer agarilyticus]